MNDPDRHGADIIVLKKRAIDRERENGMRPPPEDGDLRTRQNIAALIFLAALVLVGLWLVHVLGKQGALEDCLMSGRTNCAPIQVPPRTY